MSGSRNHSTMARAAPVVPGEEPSAHSGSPSHTVQQAYSPVVDAAAAKLSWFGRFASAELETEFVSDRRRDLARSYFYVVLVVFVLSTARLVLALMRPAASPSALSEGLTHGLYAFNLPPLVLYLHVWRWPEGVGARVPTWALDASFVVWVLSKSIILVVDPVRLALLDPLTTGRPNPPEVVEATLQLSGWLLYVRVLALLMTAGLFTRMQLPTFAITCVTSGLLTIAAELLSPSQLGRVLLTQAPLTIFCLAAVVRSTMHRVRTERAMWSYRREVVRAARMWDGVKLVELEARERASRLEAAKTARARLIRVVMHDLRSPLLSVRNMVDTLAELAPATPLADAGVARSLSALVTCTSMMEGIVSDMLDFERIDSGRLQLAVRPFELERMLSDAEVAFATLAERKGLRVHFEPLPPELAGARYWGDSRRLLQCLGNGLSNAVKFTEKGGTITLSASEGAPVEPVGSPELAGAEAGDDDASGGTPVPAPAEAERTLRIRIVDSGVGLALDELDVLHKGEAFAQVGKGQLQGNGGTGLGLTIVRHILRLHSGSHLALASSGPGQGTTFELVLRLRRAGGAAADGPEQTAGSISAAGEAGTAPPAPPARPLACLHVEDDQMLQLTLGARLFADPQRAIAVVASDGREALELVNARAVAGEPAFDLVLMDNQMPRLGGTGATAELRARGFTGVIVGMTGDPAGSPDRVEFEAAGLNLCVDKTPEGLDVVLAEMARLLSEPALTPL